MQACSTTNRVAYVATYWFQKIGEVSGDMERASFVIYPYLVCFLISGFKRRIRRDRRVRMRERRCNPGYTMIILLVNGQVGTTGNDIR